jgi:NADH dehydrogenase
VDATHKIVSLDDGHLEYDICAVCLGGRTAYYGLPGLADHATPLKRIADAKAIRQAFLSLSGEDRVVIGGAGLSGIQVAGELAELGETRDASPEITVLEQKSTVAPGFDDGFQRAVAEGLTDHGIDIQTERTVKRATDGAIHFADGSMLDYDQFIWTGGIQGPDAFGGDRPHVRSNLQAEPGTFVLGDAGRIVDSDGEVVPPTAQAAVKAAKVTATNIQRIVDHDESSVFDPRLEQFTFEPRGWLVSIGDSVVAQVGPRVITGRSAKVMKATVGARYLTGVGAVENALDVVYEELGFNR